ncbi:APC amino acid permease [Armillaria borealis]|uniref:APC amino acid permease n=1 Tax=Armillaria borealis TaxID=47425 RepID=A0AA39JFM4_9AGAR|nr:APC amino acid permease [Armillaria borealis]
MVWGWAVCFIFIAAITLATADLASAAPTSGGLYYWTFMFSSEKWRCFLSWIVGYSNTISNVASVAGVNWACAVQIMAAVSIGSDLAFQTTIPQTFGLYCALLLGQSLICSFKPRLMARLQTLFIIINVLLFCAIVIGLPVATPKAFRNDAKFALEDITNVSGWPNGFAFILSFLTPLWTVGCYDAPVHMSEEATNASIAVPMAIIFSIFSASILGWAMNISLVFCMGRNYQTIIDSPIGQPMATVDSVNSFGKTGTLVVWSFIILTQFAISLNQMLTASRQIFALSRDGSQPTPVWFGACWSLLLGCLAFAGDNAIGAIFSLGVTGQFVSFCIPMSARFLGGKAIKPGPFRLGLLSFPITAIAVTFMTFMTIVFMFPLTPFPGYVKTDFAGGVLILATVYFYFPKYGGINWFIGPISTVEAPAVHVKNDAAEKE